MTTIYIFKLSDDKYYIGRTGDVDAAFSAHLAGEEAAFTQKYKPLFIERTIENTSPFDVDRYVKEYMCNYGIENVRGGSYYQLNLDNNRLKSIDMEIRYAQSRCIMCGNAEHVIPESSTHEYVGYKSDSSDDEPSSDSDSDDEEKKPISEHEVYTLQRKKSAVMLYNKIHKIAPTTFTAMIAALEAAGCKIEREKDGEIAYVSTANNFLKDSRYIDVVLSYSV